MGIAHASLQQKNYKIALHIMHAFFTQPQPVYATYKGWSVIDGKQTHL